MQQKHLVAFLIVLIAIAGGVTWYLHDSSRGLRDQTPSAGNENFVPGQAIYTNGQYGFSFMYPEDWGLFFDFDAFYHLPKNWRMNAHVPGTPVVRLVSFQTESDHSYPRYFTSEIRIGASTDKAEVARCTTAAIDQDERPLPDKVIGGVTFKAFAFEGAAMMQYDQGISYRALRGDTCLAIEQLQTGSHYRDDPPSPDDIAEVELQKHYQALAPILDTFSFVSK